MTLEVRNAEVLEVRDNGDGTHSAELRIVTYKVADSYSTSFDDATFEDTIRSGKIPAMWAHDNSRPIGVVHNLRNTPAHLDGTLTYLDFSSVPDARMAHAAMKAGAMPGVSFSFERLAGSDRPDPELRGVTRIGKAIMHEVSAVLVNAIPGSRVLSVRAVDTEESLLRSVAADVLIKFQQGKLDLADALQAIKSGTITAEIEEDDLDHSDDDDKPEEEEVTEPTEEELKDIADQEAQDEAEEADILAQLDKLGRL